MKENKLHITGGIFYCRDSAGFSISASNKISYNLTGQCSEIGNKNIPPNRYRKPYDDIANIKRTDMKRTFLNNMGQRTTLLAKANAEKKTKKMPPHKKFFATAQNTLSFFLQTHKPNAEKKMKECFPQRFIPFSVANEFTVYESYIRNLNISR